MTVLFVLNNFTTNSTDIPDGDHPISYGDQKMYKIASKREDNARRNPDKLQTLK